MNRIQRQSFRELLQEEGYEDSASWIQDHWDDSPQLGICAHCGYFEWNCDPDTLLTLCPDCGREEVFSSALILLGVI
jgi:hypothetical protein